jgi:hypothetical protein
MPLDKSSYRCRVLRHKMLRCNRLGMGMPLSALCSRDPSLEQKKWRAGGVSPCPDRSTLRSHPFELIRLIRPIGPISLDEEHTPIADPARLPPSQATDHGPRTADHTPLATDR